MSIINCDLCLWNLTNLVNFFQVNAILIDLKHALNLNNCQGYVPYAKLVPKCATVLPQ